MAVLRLPLPGDASSSSSSSAQTNSADDGRMNNRRRVTSMTTTQQHSSTSASISLRRRIPNISSASSTSPTDYSTIGINATFSTTPITSNLASSSLSSPMALGMMGGGGFPSFTGDNHAHRTNIISSSSSSSSWSNLHGGNTGVVVGGAIGADVTAHSQSTQWQYPWQRLQQPQQHHHNNHRPQQQQQHQSLILPPKHPATAISLLGGRGGTNGNLLGPVTTTNMPLSRMVGGGHHEQPQLLSQHQQLLHPHPKHQPPMQQMKSLTLGTQAVAAVGSGEQQLLPETSPEEKEEEEDVVEEEEEVPLNTGPVTLGIHEAQTFDGVELALHPDVFAGSNNSCSNFGDAQEQCLRPGDLVEIRVWCALPGMAAQASSVLQQSNSLVDSVLKPKPGTTTSAVTTRQSLHSRNASLTTVTSSISNTSLTNTPLATQKQQLSNIIVQAPPPLQVLVGGGGSMLSLCGSVDGNSTESDKLFGENLLHGEILFETPKAPAPAISASNITSVLSDAASSLFRKISAPLVEDAGGSQHSEDASVFTHSRDNSLVSNTTREEDVQLPLPVMATANTLPQEAQFLSLQRDSKLMTPSSSPHLPLSPTSHSANLVKASSPSSAHSSPPKQMAPPKSTPNANPIRSKSVNAPISAGSNTPTVRRSASASVEKLPPTLFLTSDIGAPTNSLQVAYTATMQSRSNPPHGGTDSNHDRHQSIMRSSGSAIGVENSTVSSHRRHCTSIPATTSSLVFSSSFPAPTLPQSAVGSTIQKGNMVISASNTSKQITDMLQSTHNVRISFIMPVSEGSLTSIKSGARTKVSLLRTVADLYGITAYDTVTVTQIARSKSPIVQQSIAADFLTVTFKDQFVSRGDMYKFQKEFINSWVYEGKRLSSNGIQTITKVIRRGDHVVRAALISEDTKLTFRSRSARIIWLVQMSSEMWDFAPPYDAVGTQTNHEPSCKIYFDKFVDFVRRLFSKWKKLQLTHNLTVVFFSRTYIRQQEGESEEKSSTSVHVDSDGRKFVDHYKIVIDNEMSAGDNLILRIKQEFVNYPKEVMWNLTRGNERTPSTASQGNVLEAINITLNLLHLHYIDRDLHRTGNSIVVITPGNGVFEIEKNLAGITKQRMMDNGIGSDMLSLGLPPLHVAPFFLYKEKGTSSAEEIQGFDDWKTYFEVPHWMNLSFVDYDNDEEPHKENVNDDDINDNTDKIGDDKILFQWSASNGFLKRHRIGLNAPEKQRDPRNSERHQYKHLISDRDFEDILQACRPRYRGEHGTGLPLSLETLLDKVAPGVNIETERPVQEVSSDDKKYFPTHHGGNNSRSKHLEWGAVNFDEDVNPKTLINSQQTNNRFIPDLPPSPSSSFTNIGSHLLNRFSSKLLDSPHLQSPRSLEARRFGTSVGDSQALSQKAMKSGAGNNAAQHTLSDIRMMMAEHDENTFYNSIKDHDKYENKAQSLMGDSIRNNVIESFCPVSPVLERRDTIRSHVFPKGGIEAALIQHDGSFNREGKHSRLGAVLNSNGSPILSGVSPPSLAVSPLRLGITPISLDRRNEGLRPSVMRLVAPDVIPRASRFVDAADAFQPLESQRKTLSQTHAKSRDDVYHYNKAPSHSVTDNRLLHRRKSQWDNVEPSGSTEIGSAGERNSQTLSPQRVKIKTQVNRKPQQLQSFRNRQKSWVLNPFRQEDEEEVLAKRTHNRRRWSHVFPLGEDEFKRHAGPNWKSLCQPAILPMTIDFHPSPQDLDDQAKFSVKQYSVTLPPMNETTYTSHTELLDDLLMQRMRQDFQIVPRNIIRQHARRDAENVLEATLSMGHKIQRLSYNPSTDSVDVVQYYARFAEDETPQTYHYLLWSTLQQDYVKASQTFTKYTRPYRWNELDMLIGGDAETTILEGMRHPRISFLIIPDTFADSQGENEYLNKFQRLMEYFGKLLPKDESNTISIEMITSSEAGPQASSGDKRFVVDLRKKRDDKYEWMEVVHDSNCDTRRTFRITVQWLVAVASKIDQHAKNLQRRCSQYGLKLVSAPHCSCLRSCFMNPFAVPINNLVHDKDCVDAIEQALTKYFDFVYDGNHMSDPNDIECLDSFDFVANKWSIKEKKEFVVGRQYLHRTGTLFIRFLRDTRGCAIIIIYLNQRHIAGDERLLWSARAVFHRVEQYIVEVCKESGCFEVLK